MEESNDKVSEKMPKTEVVAKAKHRRFTAEYKLRILRELGSLIKRTQSVLLKDNLRHLGCLRRYGSIHRNLP